MKVKEKEMETTTKKTEKILEISESEFEELIKDVSGDVIANSAAVSEKMGFDSPAILLLLESITAADICIELMKRIFKEDKDEVKN